MEDNSNVVVNNDNHNSVKNKSYSLNMRFGLKSVFTYIFVIILIISVIRVSLEGNVLTLDSFLTFLQNFSNSTSYDNLYQSIARGLQDFTIAIPSIDILGLVIDFGWLNSFLNIFADLFSIVYWLLGNLVYVVYFIIELMRFVFVI